MGVAYETLRYAAVAFAAVAAVSFAFALTQEIENKKAGWIHGVFLACFLLFLLCYISSGILGRVSLPQCPNCEKPVSSTFCPDCGWTNFARVYGEKRDFSACP